MKYFVTTNSNGSIATRLIEGVNIIPNDAIPISGEDWFRTSQEIDGVWFVSADGVCEKRPFPPPTSEELEASRKVELLTVTQLAANQKSALNNRIGVINDAIEYEEATPEEVAELPQRQAQLTAWKKYAVQLGRVTAQPGWYETVIWPEQPTEGIDLGVSPVGRTS